MHYKQLMKAYPDAKVTHHFFIAYLLSIFCRLFFPWGTQRHGTPLSTRQSTRLVWDLKYRSCFHVSFDILLLSSCLIWYLFCLHAHLINLGLLMEKHPTAKWLVEQVNNFDQQERKKTFWNINNGVKSCWAANKMKIFQRSTEGDLPLMKWSTSWTLGRFKAANTPSKVDGWCRKLRAKKFLPWSHHLLHNRGRRCRTSGDWKVVQWLGRRGHIEWSWKLLKITHNRWRGPSLLIVSWSTLPKR